MKDKLWIARDENGALYLYCNRPIRHKYGDKIFFVPSDNDNTIIKLDSYTYPEVTFENSPQQFIQLEKTLF